MAPRGHPSPDEALSWPLPRLAGELRARRLRAVELVEAAIARHATWGETLKAYVLWDPEAARTQARAADARLEAGDPAPLLGIPVSVKDLYGVEGWPTFAGSPAPLPPPWTRDAWLVARMGAAGAVVVGKTHTVEFAYGAVGLNPHYPTPRNPWDPEVHRVPGGSSAGAGVSLAEGSALVALGTDTGGSVRIPASLTGVVGMRGSPGRWPADGVVPLSPTLDVVGALTRSVEDQVYVFGAVDPAWGDPRRLRMQLAPLAAGGLTLAIPEYGIWEACAPGIAAVLDRALRALEGAGWVRRAVEGAVLDRAGELYRTGGIAAAELNAFLDTELPEWRPRLHPLVGTRLHGAPATDSEAYREALERRRALLTEAEVLFRHADLVALPGHLRPAPPVAEMHDPERYAEANTALLAPTAPASILGLPALTLPAGYDEAGLPVGLQLLAPGGADERLLGAALAVEAVLGGR